MWHSGTRILNRALLGTLVVCLMLAATSGAVSAMTPVGTWINNTCTLTQQSSASVLLASYDTQVVNWIDVTTDSPLTSVRLGDTVWLPFTVTNSAGKPDTVTIDTSSLLGWRVTLWDSRGASGSPLAAVQKLDTGQVLQFRVAACTTAGASGVTDTVRVRAVSNATATAYDSAFATIRLESQLAGFRFTVPAAIYVGVPFNVVVTAYTDAARTVVATTYDTWARLYTDTGQVNPDSLARGTWVNGACTATVTISNCRDTTVSLWIQDGAVAETVTITAVDYRIALDKAVYQGLTDLIRVTVWDSRQDTTAAVNYVRVLVTSSSDATGITVTLAETGDTTGIFAGNVRFTQGGSQPDAIKVDSNGNITVSYDPDGAGGVPAVAAQVSWLALVIGDLDRVRSWPNPFRPSQGDREIVIHQLPADPGMVIEVYNTAAQLVRTLRAGREIAVTPQENIARWDGSSDAGGAVASGTYVYVVKSAAGTVVRKLTIIR